MKNTEAGQILILSLVFMVVLIFLSAGLFGFVGQNILATRNAVADEQSLQLAEAGIDKAVWQLNETAGGYTGETGTSFGEGVFDVAVTDISSSRKQITAMAYVPGKANPQGSKTVRVEVSIDTTVVSFNYAVQVGNGGVEMDNNSRIEGNLYSNGTVNGGSGAQITGDVFSSGPAGRIYDQLQIDGDAHAHTIDGDVQIGGSAYGFDMDNITVGGNVWTNSVSRCTVGGDVNYTSISSCTVGGDENSGYPGEDDPESLDYPISDEQIQDWKDSAESGGTITGDFIISNGETATLGPKKITGALRVDNGAELTLTGPLWVEGDAEISNNGIVSLADDYNGGSEVIVSDDLVNVSNNAVFNGDGEDSYIMMVSTASGDDVFTLDNNSDTLVIFVPNGEVEIANNALVREVTANQLHLNNNAEVIYEEGLSNMNFTSGPGASWQIQRGTWQIVD